MPCREAEEEVNDPNAAKKFVCRGLIRYMEVSAGNTDDEVRKGNVE
jgi:hypothetical protein